MWCLLMYVYAKIGTVNKSCFHWLDLKKKTVGDEAAVEKSIMIMCLLGEEVKGGPTWTNNFI